MLSKSLTLATTFLALALIGCGGSSDKPAAGEKPASAASGEVDRTIRINVGDEPESLDPAQMTSTAASKVLAGLFEGLVTLDANSKPQPAVAESWTPNEDYTVWTFKLRSNAKWHNGETVTAGDFKYSIERLLSPSTAAQYASIAYDFVKGGEEFYKGGGHDKGLDLAAVKAPDATTLVIELEAPTIFFPTMLGLPIWMPVHRATVEKHGSSTWSLRPETYMGNGAFKMTAYRPKERIELTKTDTYWNNASIFWNKAIILTIDSDNTEYAAFTNGEVDVTFNIPIQEIPSWRGKPELMTFPTIGSYFVGFNCKKPPFDDARVRKAFSLAIDRSLITERITRRKERTSTGFLPRGFVSPQGGDFRDHTPDFVGGTNVEAAKKLLAEAGYGPGGKQLPPLDYLYATREENKLIAEQLQSMWLRAFGVDVRLVNVEAGVYFARTSSHDFQMARQTWFGDYLDPLTFMDLNLTGGSQNDGQYENPRYDELVNKARVERDPVAREKLFIEAERILIAEDAAVAPIYDYQVMYLKNAQIEGVATNSLAGLIWTTAKRVAK